MSRIALGPSAEIQIGTRDPGASVSLRVSRRAQRSRPRGAPRSASTRSRSRSSAPAVTPPVPTPRISRPRIARARSRRPSPSASPCGTPSAGRRPRAAGAASPRRGAERRERVAPEISGRNSAAYPAFSAARTIAARSSQGNGSRSADGPRRCGAVPDGCRCSLTAGIVHAMEPLRFTTEDGVSLEGELRRPEAGPRGSVVICHAHPRHGGARTTRSCGRSATSSPGVASWCSRSTSAGRCGAPGRTAGGRSETKDVAAAIGRVRQEADGPTVAVGWSFGANVALREALEDDRVAALALVGLPLEHRLDIPEAALARRSSGRSASRSCCSPASTTSTRPSPVRELASAFPNAGGRIVPGTDHYLWRHERDAAAIIGGFAERGAARLLGGRRLAALLALGASPPERSRRGGTAGTGS